LRPVSLRSCETGITEGAALTEQGTCLSISHRPASGAAYQLHPAGITGSGRNGRPGLVTEARGGSISPGRATVATGIAAAGCWEHSGGGRRAAARLRPGPQCVT
jgi:hypothetical protein